MYFSYTAHDHLPMMLSTGDCPLYQLIIKKSRTDMPTGQSDPGNSLVEAILTDDATDNQN